MSEFSLAVVTRDQAPLLKSFYASFLQAAAAVPSPPPLIFINDGSEDGTRDLLEEWATRHAFIRAIHQSASGAAAARNNALRQCKTEWLAFTDSDCLLPPDYLARLAAGIAANPDAIAIEGAILSPPLTSQTLFTHHCENLHGGMYATANMAFRVAPVLALGGFDTGFPLNFREDSDLGLRIQAHQPIPFVPEWRVIHPRVPLHFRHRLSSAWWRQGLLVRAELRLWRRHPQAYRTIRSRPTGWKTISRWCQWHWWICLGPAVRLVLGPSVAQSAGTDAFTGNPWHSLSQLAKLLVLSAWEQVCILLHVLLHPFSPKSE